MATFRAKGADDLRLSMQEVAEIPDEVKYQMLEAGAQSAVNAQKRTIRAAGLVKTGTLVESVRLFRKLSKDRYGDMIPSVVVYPYGAHHKYMRRVVTKTYARSKHGRTYSVGGNVATATNNDVGFVLNFGSKRRGIKAARWADKAVEQCAAAVEKAEFEVYDRWLKEKNL